MTEFSERPLAERLNGDSTAGDLAEDAFRRYMGQLGRAENEDYASFGAVKVSTSHALEAHQEPFIRLRPDFYSVGGNLYEVQGFGHDGIIKVKVEKLDVLRRDYSDKLTGARQFRFFFYDLTHDRYLLVTMTSLLGLLEDPRVTCAHRPEMDNKLVHYLPAEVLEDHLVADAFAYEKRLYRAAQAAAARGV